MFALLCTHCNKGVDADDEVYVINKHAYCPECFRTFVTDEARMKAKDYANAWGSITKVVSKE